MFIHMFAFRWKPEASQAQKDRALADIHAFQGQIAGLIETALGMNQSPRGVSLIVTASNTPATPNARKLVRQPKFCATYPPAKVAISAPAGPPIANTAMAVARRSSLNTSDR